MNIKKTIDHTNIDPEAGREDIIQTCKEAKEYEFRGVDVNPEWTSLVKEQLEGSDIKVIVLVDPPMGLSSTQERVEICEKVKKEGAQEVDIVMNIVDMKHDRHEKILEDLRAVCEVAPTKVIIGSGYLTDDEVKKASEIVKEAGGICVKTATFKDPLGKDQLKKKAEHVSIMKEAAPGLLIKASGKISNLEDAKMMIDSGADIIGTSSGVEIIEEENSN